MRQTWVKKHIEYERDFLFNPILLQQFKKLSQKEDRCWQWELDAGQKTIHAIQLKFDKKVDTLLTEIEERNDLKEELIIVRKHVRKILDTLNPTDVWKLRVQYVTESDWVVYANITIKKRLNPESFPGWKPNDEYNVAISPELSSLLIKSITHNEKRKRDNGINNDEVNYGSLTKRSYNWPWRVSEVLYPRWRNGEKIYKAEVEVETIEQEYISIPWLGPEITFNSDFNFMSQSRLQIEKVLSEKKIQNFSKWINPTLWRRMILWLINKFVKKTTLPSASSSQNLPPLE